MTQIERIQLAREIHEERAAILEYDAGYPRLEADRLAWEQLAEEAP